MANEVKRMRYFDGLFLKQDEFSLDQEYHTRMRRLHNRYLHSWGIVAGLDVVMGPGLKEVTVKEGIALNKTLVDGEDVSQEIIIVKDMKIDLSSFNAGESVYIYTSYAEKAADIVEEKGGEEEVNRILKQIETEAPRVKVGFRKGQSVRVVDGPFIDFMGIVDEINVDRGKVKVLLFLFGRETPVELDFLQVEKL